MVTISLFLKNSASPNLHSVCLALTFGARTLSLLMDVGANHALRFSCRAGTEPAPTTIRKHPEPSAHREATSPRDAN